MLNATDLLCFLDAYALVALAERRVWSLDDVSVLEQQLHDLVVVALGGRRQRSQPFRHVAAWTTHVACTIQRRVSARLRKIVLGPLLLGLSLKNLTV